MSSRKKRAEEWLKCKVNPKYFIRNYVKIVHQEKGIIPFDMYDFQERALSDLFNYDYTITLKARQMGLTTLLSAYALWLMVFQENKEILALSYKQNKARNIIKKIKRMNSHLPSWMKESTPIDNQLEVEFGNGSKASAESTTSDAGRSESASFVIIDEAAFIDGAEEVWSAVKLTLDVGGGTCAVLSTPTGVGTWFHETWQKSVQGDRIKKVSNDPEVWKGVGENDFHPIKLHWSLHPERDQEWREEQTRTMGEKKAARECDCDFSTSGDTVIDQQIIRWYEKKAVEEPMERHRRGKGDVHVWEPPETGKTYIMASDVARGDSSDYSTFVIYKAVEMEQVAEYKGKMPPSEFGDLLYSYGSMYNDALLVIERDSYGWAAIQKVIDRDYPNILYTSNDLKLVEIDENNTTGRSKKMNPGLDTNRTTRSLIISSLQRFMRKKWIHPKSERYTDELQTFVWKNHGTRQKPEHMDGYNDDLVFATAFACWARDKALKYRAEMGQRSEQSLNGVKGSGLIFSGNGGMDDPYTQDIGGHKEDMRWLFD